MTKFLVAIFVVLTLMQFAVAQHAESAAKSGFSFAVYSDSRSMMYLPYKQDQEAEARWGVAARNKIRYFPAGRTSRSPTVTRRTSIGKVPVRSRNITLSS